MDRKDLLLDHSQHTEIEDNLRIFDADEYIDSKQEQISKIQSAISIQCALRAHWARDKVQALQAKKEEQIEQNRQKLKQQQKLLEKKQKLLEYKKNHPRHSYQFKRIIDRMTHYNNKELSELMKHKHVPKHVKSQHKTRMIHEHYRKLLNVQQTQQSIQKKHRRIQQQNLLKQMMSPKTWIMSDGQAMSVRTPTTHRAEQLILIYNALKDNSMSNEHRLELLGTLQRVITTQIEVDTMEKQKDIEEICQLIQREQDMIARKRPKKSLRGLRSRLIRKYFDLLLIPQFNPEAARFSATPRYVSPKLKPKLVSKAYDETNHVRRTHAVTPDTNTFVQFTAA